MIRFKFLSDRGSTLIELIIAVMVVGLIVTAVASAVTNSIKNTGEARYKQVGTALGQEALEFIRKEKNRIGMINLKNSLPSNSYCFSTMPTALDTQPSTGACGPADIVAIAGSNFTRDVVTVSRGAGTTVDPYSIEVTVTVSWNDGTSVRSVELIQDFKQAN